MRELFLIPAASTAALAVALISQYFFGLHPCEMCQWQRVPYVLAVLAGIIFWRKRPGIFLIYFLLMLAETILAFYHFGLENGWYAGFTKCSSSGAAANNSAEMLEKILSAPIISCNQPQFEFLGLSMAGWNGIYALMLTILSMIFFVRAKNAAR